MDLTHPVMVKFVSYARFIVYNHSHATHSNLGQQNDVEIFLQE